MLENTRFLDMVIVSLCYLFTSRIARFSFTALMLCGASILSYYIKVSEEPKENRY